MLATILRSTTLPVDLAGFKRWAEIDQDDRDTELTVALKAAINYVETYTGLMAQPKTLQLRLDSWFPPCPRRPQDLWIEIPAAPVRQISSVTYVDTSGVEQTVPAESYSWERSSEGARLQFVSDFSVPDLKADRHGVVRVTFDAGFDDPAQSGSGDDEDLKLSDDYKLCVLALAAHFYNNREAVGDPGAGGQVIVPNHCQSMLDQLRIYR